MNKEPIAYIIERECCTCGESFEIRVNWDTNKIETECFYGGMFKLGVGTWSKSRMEENPDGIIKWVRIHSRWKELWYRLIDLKRLLLHQYIEVEYWECPKCLKEIKDKYE